LTASHRISDASIAALSATKTPEKSIAVLPFESLSDDKSDTYFADGVQDENPFKPGQSVPAKGNQQNLGDDVSLHQ
jgi:hypothetical protein